MDRQKEKIDQLFSHFRDLAIAMDIKYKQKGEILYYIIWWWEHNVENGERIWTLIIKKNKNIKEIRNMGQKKNSGLNNVTKRFQKNEEM